MAGLILLKPILSEKAQSSAASGVYTFKVAKSSNKKQIKKAVEAQFGVKVAEVRTMNSKSEIKRQGRNFGKINSVKKAIVKLREGSINLWASPEKEGKNEKRGKEEKPDKKDKEKKGKGK